MTDKIFVELIRVNPKELYNWFRLNWNLGVKDAVDMAKERYIDFTDKGYEEAIKFYKYCLCLNQPCIRLHIDTTEEHYGLVQIPTAIQQSDLPKDPLPDFLIDHIKESKKDYYIYKTSTGEVCVNDTNQTLKEFVDSHTTEIAICGDFPDTVYNFDIEQVNMSTWIDIRDLHKLLKVIEDEN